MTWHCDQCGEDHAPGKCPRGSFGGARLSGDGYERAVSRVELRLAHVRGQRDQNYIALYLDDLALCIEESEWRDELKRRYLDHPQLGEHLTARASGVGHNAGPPIADPLTEAEWELVKKHSPLSDKPNVVGPNVVSSLAREYSHGNPILRDELEAFGIELLTVLVRRWDRSRGVTFGAFAKRFLRGAMRDRVKHSPRLNGHATDATLATLVVPRDGRKAATNSDDKANERWSKADVDLADYVFGRRVGKSKQTSATKRKAIEGWVNSFLATGGTVKRTTPLLNEQLEAAIKTLKPNEQMVYRECYLKDTPIETVACRLNIRHVSQISRIKKRAIKKVTTFLKVSNHDGI